MEQIWITRENLMARVVDMMFSEFEYVTYDRSNRITGNVEGASPIEHKRADCTYFMKGNNNPK